MSIVRVITVQCNRCGVHYETSKIDMRAWQARREAQLAGWSSFYTRVNGGATKHDHCPRCTADDDKASSEARPG